MRRIVGFALLVFVLAVGAWEYAIFAAAAYPGSRERYEHTSTIVSIDDGESIEVNFDL